MNTFFKQWLETINFSSFIIIIIIIFIAIIFLTEITTIDFSAWNENNIFAKNVEILHWTFIQNWIKA